MLAGRYPGAVSRQGPLFHNHVKSLGSILVVGTSPLRGETLGLWRRPAARARAAAPPAPEGALCVWKRTALRLKRTAARPHGARGDRSYPHCTALGNIAPQQSMSLKAPPCTTTCAWQQYQALLPLSSSPKHPTPSMPPHISQPHIHAGVHHDVDHADGDGDRDDDLRSVTQHGTRAGHPGDTQFYNYLQSAP